MLVLDYRRTALNGELEGKKFKYGDLKLEYKEENIVSIKMYALEGYSHRVITFADNIHLYFRETNTQMYYFLSDTLIGECYKVIYQKSSEETTNFFNRERFDINLVGVDYYIEFTNESCEGYGLLNSNEKKVFIPVESNKMVVVDLFELKNSLTQLTELDDFICYSDGDILKYENARDYAVNRLNINEKLLAVYKFNNSYYLSFENTKTLRVQNFDRRIFLSYSKNIPIKANAIYKAYVCQKRTNGVTDVINGAFGYFNW